jgi:CubicO group peptidase (beta-lactamase class C family)
MTTNLADRLQQTVQGSQPTNLHGVVVLRHGELVYEYYGTGPDYSWGVSHGVVGFGPDTLHDLRSVTKSIVGLLYGIAWEAGDVPGPDEPLLSHFPEYPDLAEDPARARLTVRHALTMTLGLEWNEGLPYTSPANSEIAMELASDRTRYVLERPIVDEPGTRWSYCGGASALLGRLISMGTGTPLPAFAESALFAPLGIGSYEWMAGDDGVASAASGLRLAPRDLARIGQTVLAGGRPDGRQIVPAGWLAEALRPHVPIGDGRHYGYQWYLGATDAVRWAAAMGNGGQRLCVVPDLELVITITAGDYDAADQAGAIVDDLIRASTRR